MSGEKSKTKKEIIACGLNTKQAAKYIGSTPKTMANYRSLEQGPHYWKNGKEIIYDPDDLDDYLEVHMRKVNTVYYETFGIIRPRCKGELASK